MGAPSILLAAVLAASMPVPSARAGAASTAGFLPTAPSYPAVGAWGPALGETLAGFQADPGALADFPQLRAFLEQARRQGVDFQDEASHSLLTPLMPGLMTLTEGAQERFAGAGLLDRLTFLELAAAQAADSEESSQIILYVNQLLVLALPDKLARLDDYQARMLAEALEDARNHFGLILHPDMLERLNDSHLRAMSSLRARKKSSREDAVSSWEVRAAPDVLAAMQRDLKDRLRLLGEKIAELAGHLNERTFPNERSRVKFLHDKKKWSNDGMAEIKLPPFRVFLRALPDRERIILLRVERRAGLEAHYPGIDAYTARTAAGDGLPALGLEEHPELLLALAELQRPREEALPAEPAEKEKPPEEKAVLHYPPRSGLGSFQNTPNNPPPAAVEKVPERPQWVPDAELERRVTWALDRLPSYDELRKKRGDALAALRSGDYPKVVDHLLDVSAKQAWRGDWWLGLGSLFPGFLSRILYLFSPEGFGMFRVAVTLLRQAVPPPLAELRQNTEKLLEDARRLEAGPRPSNERALELRRTITAYGDWLALRVRRGELAGSYVKDRLHALSPEFRDAAPGLWANHGLVGTTFNKTSTRIPN